MKNTFIPLSTKDKAFGINTPGMYIKANVISRFHKYS